MVIIEPRFAGTVLVLSWEHTRTIKRVHVVTAKDDFLASRLYMLNCVLGEKKLVTTTN